MRCSTKATWDGEGTRLYAPRSLEVVQRRRAGQEQAKHYKKRREYWQLTLCACNSMAGKLRWSGKELYSGVERA